MATDHQAEIDGLRLELDGARADLQACREDVTEAYSMLAKAGLDWAKERQVNAGLQEQCDDLLNQLYTAQQQCEISNAGEKLQEAVLLLIQEREALTRQLEDATSALESEREARMQEQRRRESMENTAVEVLKMALEAKKETQSESHFRQNAEEAAVALLKWVAAEKDCTSEEHEKLDQERKDVEAAHGWRECSVRLKMQDAQLELIERIDRLDLMERTIQHRLEKRGLALLWSKVEAEGFLRTMSSLRNPLLSESVDESPEMEAPVTDVHSSYGAPIEASHSCCGGAEGAAIDACRKEPFDEDQQCTPREAESSVWRHKEGRPMKPGPLMEIQGSSFCRSFSGSSDEGCLSLQHPKLIVTPEEMGAGTPDSDLSPGMVRFTDKSSREFMDNSSSDDHMGVEDRVAQLPRLDKNKNHFHTWRKDALHSSRRKISRLSRGGRQGTAWA